MLDSVAGQTYPHVEHIVIDGGSSDGSHELLIEAESAYGIRWQSEPDDGVYDAVNKGLKMATGDILAYINTDDFYFPYTVEAVVDSLRDPWIQFVFGDMIRFDEEQDSGQLLLYPPFSKRYLARGWLIGQPTMFWRRQVTSSIGYFDTSLSLAADMAYWMRMSERFSGVHVNEVLAYEGHHHGRLTSGEVASVEGQRQLGSLLQRHYPDAAARTGPRRFLPRLAWGFWSRVATLRFLLATTQRKSARPGILWSGFLGAKTSLRVNPGLLAATLIPYLGRRAMPVSRPDQDP